MAFTWRTVPSVPPGGGLDPDQPASFASQSDAESWLGEHWRLLARSGVDEVTLLDGSRAVYDLTLSL